MGELERNINYFPWNVTVFPSVNVTIKVLLLKLQLKIILLSLSPTQALLVLRSIFATLYKSDFVAMKCEDFSSQTPLFLKAVIILFPGAIASKAPSLLFGIFMNKTLVYSSSVIFEFRVIFCPTVPIKVWEKSSVDVM